MQYFHHHHHTHHDPHTDHYKEHKHHHTTYKSLYIYSMVLSQVLGTMLFYVTANFNSVLKFVQYHAFDQEVPKIQLTLMTSFLPLGAAFGAVSAGKIAATYGRLKPMLGLDALAILGTVLTLLPSPISLLIGRLIQGFCCGADSGLVPLYIREVSPTEISGKLGTFNQLFLTLGQLLPNLIGLGMPLGKGDSDPDNKLYLVILAMAGVFPLLRIIFTLLIFRHETPRWLISINKENETKELLKRFYTEERVETELAALKVWRDIQSRAKKVTLFEIFSKKYRKRLLIGCVIAAGQRIVGVNALTFYANDIFSVGDAVGTRRPQIYTCIVFAMASIGAFFSEFLIERLGRKKLLVIGAGAVGTTIGIFGILTIVEPGSAAAKWFVWIYMLIYGLTIGPISWIYIADILPEVGIAVSTLALWMVIFLIGIIFPYVPKSGMGYTFIFFAVCSLCCMTFSIFMVKETKGKSKTEIDAMFEKKGKAVEDKDQHPLKIPTDHEHDHHEHDHQDALSVNTDESAGLKKQTVSEVMSPKIPGEGLEPAKDSTTTPAPVDNQQINLNIKS